MQAVRSAQRRAFTPDQNPRFITATTPQTVQIQYGKSSLLPGVLTDNTESSLVSPGHTFAFGHGMIYKLSQQQNSFQPVCKEVDTLFRRDGWRQCQRADDCMSNVRVIVIRNMHFVE